MGVNSRYAGFRNGNLARKFPGREFRKMAGTISLESRIQSSSAEQVSTATLSIPWYIWCAVLSVICAVVGSEWDISWHEAIGRDTFWTPAHILIYLSGVLAGISCGYVILSTTFEKDSPL